MEELARFPAFNYYLDESDPDIVMLRRQDGSFVAAFSAEGATKEGIVEAAKEDYRTLLTRGIAHSRDFGVIREFSAPDHWESQGLHPTRHEETQAKEEPR